MSDLKYLLQRVHNVPAPTHEEIMAYKAKLHADRADKEAENGDDADRIMNRFDNGHYNQGGTRWTSGECHAAANEVKDVGIQMAVAIATAPIGGEGELLLLGREADVLSVAAKAKKAGRIARVGEDAAAEETALLKPYGGKGGGHHVPAKKIFEGSCRYDFKKALAIPNKELARLGVDHRLITTAQQVLYRKLAKSGQPLTWSAIEEIETKALTFARMDPDIARATVKKAIDALKELEVEPLNIPWGD